MLIETVLMSEIIQKTKLSLDHEEEEMLLKHAEETKDFDVNVVLSLDQKVSDQQVCPLAQFFFQLAFCKKKSIDPPHCQLSYQFSVHTSGNVRPMRQVKTITMPFLFMCWCRGCVS